jgi:hypothetical protein
MFVPVLVEVKSVFRSPVPVDVEVKSELRDGSPVAKIATVPDPSAPLPPPPPPLLHEYMSAAAQIRTNAQKSPLISTLLLFMRHLQKKNKSVGNLF